MTDIPLTDEEKTQFIADELDIDGEIYDRLYEYYLQDMPYGTAKARSGDPHEWIFDRLSRDLGVSS